MSVCEYHDWYGTGGCPYCKEVFYQEKSMTDEQTNGNGATAETAPPPAEEVKIDLLPCPCGEAPGILRLEMQDRGGKVGQARGSCCGSWAVEFINNTVDSKKSVEKACAAWNAAPRAA